jgi:muconolactone D-isomerase
MEFLVRSENRLPPDTAPERRAELRAAERDRAMELREQGILRRLWRVPGRNATIGLYAAADPAALHDALTSLPMSPWLDVHVEALAAHPQEAAAQPDPDQQDPNQPDPNQQDPNQQRTSSR